MAIRIETVEWFDPRAVALREAMSAETDAMYAEFTAGQTEEARDAIDAALTVDGHTIAVTIIAIDDRGEALGHSALRPYGTELEVKKVFTTPAARGKGVAKALLLWLEEYAIERGVTSLVLQTGPLQTEAIGLYEKLGYLPISTFGAYAVIPGALCFRKYLTEGTPQ